MKYILTTFYFICLLSVSNNAQTTYIENFDNKGIPVNIPTDSYWKYFNEIHPDQNSWDKFIPGDGYAYLKVDTDINNDTDWIYPYQTLVFGGAVENHRLEVRMKGAVVDGGLVGFLFTYAENIPGTIFNEVDIEVVANDRDVEVHETLPPNGWSDARFNTWRNASTTTFLPISGSAKPVKDGNGNNISLIDDAFHTYTIDWRTDQVDFFIDNILQESFNTNVATGWGEVIIGFRHLPWAKDFNWSGIHTLTIDYFKIEPLGALSVNSEELSKRHEVAVFPNPAQNKISIVSKDFFEIQKIEILNTLGKKVFQSNNYQNSIDISQLPSGLYIVKTYFSEGTIFTNRIIKR